MVVREIETLRQGERYDAVEAWEPERLALWQLERLREIVRQAEQSNAFYRGRWEKSGVSADSLESLDDLQRFPVIEKKDLVRAGEAWSAGTGPVAFSTRGTSGEPLVVWLDRRELEAYLVPTMRGYWWAGFRGDMTALLMSPAWHRLAAMEGHAALRLGGRAAFFWGSLDSRHTAAFRRTLLHARPEFVTTTAPFLLSVVRQCEDEESDPGELFASVRFVVVVGLPLTPQLRVFLRDRLGVEDVFERSGTQEGAALDECRLHTAPHIHADVCHLDVLDEDGRPAAPGTRGRLVVTKLVPAGDPVVRYDTGDIAELFTSACGCGRSLPRLKIYGRPESSVVVDGRLVIAYDVRACIDTDPDLVGRLAVLVRDAGAAPGALTVAIEGKPARAGALEARLSESLGVDEVTLLWLGEARLGWSFRQVIERSEL